ncbi:MAG: tRNA pseudouridine(38-40) synthase TruA [Synergistaceae bacterium]|nr:tRNA pseudouridine(38-40) synthase TruA [Synergistaceae bacterium]
MPKYAIELSYDGTGFNGWQSQPGGGSVQDSVEEALRALGEPARAVGAGRTDAGVHARAQVAAFSLSKDWPPRRLTAALNAHLPPSVSVIRSAAVRCEFHARRSAISREYRYFIWNSPTCYPHIRPYVLWLPGLCYDWGRAERAARLLEGRHDFRAFCRKVDCPDVTERTVTRAKLTRRGNLVVLRVAAESFLTNMIRIAVGNLLQIALGRRDEAWLAGLLGGGLDRRSSAQTASPSGLFLWNVLYGEKINWE